MYLASLNSPDRLSNLDSSSLARPVQAGLELVTRLPRHPKKLTVVLLLNVMLKNTDYGPNISLSSRLLNRTYTLGSIRSTEENRSQHTKYIKHIREWAVEGKY